jgi:hypothetical protein
VSIVGISHQENWSTSHQLPTGTKHSGAFDKSRLLIGPVIEGGRADDQVERLVGVADLFGDADGERQPVIVSGGAGRSHHLRGGVNADQLLGVGVMACQCPNQVASATTQVEHPPGTGDDGSQSEIAGAVGDLVMEATPPAVVVTHGPIVELGDVPIRRHGVSLPPVGFVRLGTSG